MRNKLAALTVLAAISLAGCTSAPVDHSPTPASTPSVAPTETPAPQPIPETPELGEVCAADGTPSSDEEILSGDWAEIAAGICGKVKPGTTADNVFDNLIIEDQPVWYVPSRDEVEASYLGDPSLVETDCRVLQDRYNLATVMNMFDVQGAVAYRLDEIGCPYISAEGFGEEG